LKSKKKNKKTRRRRRRRRRRKRRRRRNNKINNNNSNNKENLVKHLHVMWNCNFAFNIYSVYHNLTSCPFECLLTTVNCVASIKFLIFIKNTFMFHIQIHFYFFISGIMC